MRNREQGNIFFYKKTHYHQDDYNQRWKVKTQSAENWIQKKDKKIQKVKNKRWNTKNDKSQIHEKHTKESSKKNKHTKKDNTRLVGGKRKNPIPGKR